MRFTQTQNVFNSNLFLLQSCLNIGKNFECFQIYTNLLRRNFVEILSDIYFVIVCFKLNKWCNYLLVISLFHRLYTFSICILNYSSFSITHHSNFLFFRIYCVALSIALSNEIYVIFATCAAKNNFRSRKVDFIVSAFVFFKLIL